MKLNKIIFFVFVLFFLTPVVVAEEFTPDTFDYENGKYSEINWKTVDWSRIPLNKVKEIPIEDIVYSGLNEQQRMEMTVEQIEFHIEEIEDLSNDVDVNRARDAIFSKTGVVVTDFLSSTKIENNILKSDAGSFDLTAKEKWVVYVNINGEVEVLEPKQINEQLISNNDHFTIVKEVEFVSLNGNVFVVNQLSFQNGLAYVKVGDTAKIGDYEIPTNENIVKIYLDPELIPQKGNFVYISDDNLFVNSELNGKVTVIPQPGNKLFNIVKRDYSTDPPTLIADERDELFITVSDGAGMEVISRADEDKTPLVEPFSDIGEIHMENGRMTIRYEDGKIKVIPPEPFEGKTGPIDMRNSIAFEFVFDNGGVEEVLRTSSSNRFIYFVDGKKVFSNSAGLEVSEFIEPNMMKTVEDLKYKFPKMKFNLLSSGVESDTSQITANMAQLLNQWLRDKPEIEKSLYEIELDLSNGASANPPNIYDPSDKGMRIHLGERISQQEYFQEMKIRDLKNPLFVLDHEFGHIIDYQIKKSEEKFLGLYGYINSKEFKDYVEKSATEFADSIFDEDFEDEDDYERNKEYQKERVMDILMHKFWAKKEKELGQLSLGSLYTQEISKIAKKMEGNKDFLRTYSDLEFHIQDLESVSELSADSLSFMIVMIEDEAIRDSGPNFDRLKKRFEKAVYDSAGVHFYAFAQSGALEASTIYSELPIEIARKNPQLAQLEYDRMMSLEDPPQWLKEKAETRYYAIMGGEDSTYCQTNGCGPCKLYKLTCKAN